MREPSQLFRIAKLRTCVLNSQKWNEGWAKLTEHELYMDMHRSFVIPAQALGSGPSGSPLKFNTEMKIPSKRCFESREVYRHNTSIPPPLFYFIFKSTSYIA